MTVDYEPCETEFCDKVVLVTGGSRGLGREMVQVFAERGASVVIASRKFDACAALAEEVRAVHGVRALPVACNVSDWSACDALVSAAYGEFGKVDVLVNNAGLSPTYPALDEVSEALWDKVIAVNLKGPFRLAAAIGTRMANAGGGLIINIGSIAAVRPRPGDLPYACAKAGLNTLTEGLALAFGPTVRVNCVQAGPFRTDISAAWPKENVRSVERSAALARIGEPSEIVGTALFFASRASSFCTGATLRLDGGLR